MGLKGILLWPAYRIADWVDANPIRAMGVVVALGALAVLLAPVAFGARADAAGLAFDSSTAGAFAETAAERPAYLAAVVGGLALLLFYKG